MTEWQTHFLECLNPESSQGTKKGAACLQKQHHLQYYLHVCLQFVKICSLLGEKFEYISPYQKGIENLKAVWSWIEVINELSFDWNDRLMATFSSISSLLKLLACFSKFFLSLQIESKRPSSFNFNFESQTLDPQWPSLTTKASCTSLEHDLLPILSAMESFNTSHSLLSVEGG